MAQVRERSKEQLYREAKPLGVKGRSKMNKGQLKAAVDRRWLSVGSREDGERSPSSLS